MFIFKEIAEKVLTGAAAGNFILRNHILVPSTALVRNTCPILSRDYPYVLTTLDKTFTAEGKYIYGSKSEPFDIIDFKKFK